MAYYIGIDIGGTKCAVSLGEINGSDIRIVDKVQFPTIPNEPYKVLERFVTTTKALVDTYNISFEGIGISCGSPLNSKTGMILSPPNLIGWDNIPVVEYFEKAFNVKSYLQNDANACAVAEWKYGAGIGTTNMIFLTFGTGFGAGLILDGRLYVGTCDMAGEIGHVRLTQDGPVGYGKAGSSEGYCSGNGIKRIAIPLVDAEIQKGNKPLLYERAGSFDNIDAKLIAELANVEKDPLCIEIYRISGEKLGMALSVLLDLFNPELIVIGSIYIRNTNLLYEPMMNVIEREALVPCKVVPAALGESVGDYAALSLAKGDFYDR